MLPMVRVMHPVGEHLVVPAERQRPTVRHLVEDFQLHSRRADWLRKASVVGAVGAAGIAGFFPGSFAVSLPLCTVMLAGPFALVHGLELSEAREKARELARRFSTLQTADPERRFKLADVRATHHVSLDSDENVHFVSRQMVKPTTALSHWIQHWLSGNASVVVPLSEGSTSTGRA